jgi:hypothetical protein
MVVSKNDKLRHRILVALNTKTDGQAYGEYLHSKWLMSVADLCDVANITDADYRRVISLMFDRDEIMIAPVNKVEQVRLKQAGLTALNEKAYLREGRKKTNESIYDVSKWLVPAALAFVTIYTAINSNLEGRRTREKIEKLQSEVNSLRAAPIPVTQPRIYHDSLASAKTDTTNF